VVIRKKNPSRTEGKMVKVVEEERRGKIRRKTRQNKGAQRGETMTKDQSMISN